jgi:hypothetical protein
MIGNRLLLALAVALVCNTNAQASGADVEDLDVAHPHRYLEAQRKAEGMQRARDAWAKATTDPNQEKWDVRFLELDLIFDTTIARITGTVDFRISVVDGPLDTAVLDLDDRHTVTAVVSGGVATSATRSGDRVVITLDRSYATGEDVEFSVSYQGIPDESLGAFGFHSSYGVPLVWSLSEPFGARTWWPCKDTPSDKADSASIHFTVPKPLSAVSNGTLENVVDLGSQQRFEWFERHPIAPYLISIAAHDYAEFPTTYTSGTGPTMPVKIWSLPSQATAAPSALTKTVDMLGAFESRFGPYPFLDEKYDQAQFNWGGGMEHQTASSMCCWTSGPLIAHELAHQWYGDNITCASFTDIWLNEGFASYAEALWAEDQGGFEGYISTMRAAQYYGPGTIRVPESDLDNTGRIFSSALSYDKASWVLHMLRGVLGDADFFAFLQAYTNDPIVGYGVATTDDARRVAEQVSGKDLSAFFDQWIDSEWYPTYILDWTSAPATSGFDVTLSLTQRQTHRLYVMPVPVRILTTGSPVDLVIQSDEVTETVVVNLAEEPTAVQLDPDDWVLRAEEAAIGQPTMDSGILLVNGVSWNTYGNEITGAHADSVFTGHQPFDFWDVFGAPAGGYVPELPTPIGNGPIDAATLGRYSTVIWVGNDYDGDLPSWIDAAVISYLDAGGNVLLMTRLGANFLTQLRMDYLGAEIVNATDTVTDAAAVYPGLVNMPSIGTQNLVSSLSPTPVQPESQVLFLDAVDNTRALGMWRRPVEGGSFRNSGGHFAHIAGRPYRFDHSALRENTEVILTDIFGEPFGSPVGTDPLPSTGRSRWTSAVPNPFNPQVELRFVLATRGDVTIELFDARGRRVRTLHLAEQAAGPGAVRWNGSDDAGATVASGVYTARLRSADGVDQQKLTLVR